MMKDWYVICCFKQKTAYEMRISDWSSDVCSADLVAAIGGEGHRLLVAVTVLSLVMSPVWLEAARRLHRVALLGITSGRETLRLTLGPEALALGRSHGFRSEEHTSELQSLMRISYDVICFNTKKLPSVHRDLIHTTRHISTTNAHDIT